MRGPNLRAALAEDPSIGAGNVLAKLIEHGAPLDGPGITFDVVVDGYRAWTPLTLGQLRDRVAARAHWLASRGIGPRDPVAVYVTSAADCLLSFMALTWLGAIPALMNGNMPGDIAVEFVRRLRAVAMITDDDHRGHFDGHDVGVSQTFDAADLGSGDPAGAPAHYRHDASDPIAITHSSGTTRMPAAVVHSHASLFAATRLVHLATPRSETAERTLCVLPAAHAAGIISHQQALCNRHELAYLSAQGSSEQGSSARGSSARGSSAQGSSAQGSSAQGSSAQGSSARGGQFADSGAVVLDAIERWRPTGIYGFAVTWAELARHDFSGRDLSSVSLWFNTGDCAHEAHIRKLVNAGSHLQMTREGVVRVAGSKFIDGIGSTEMGHSAFEAVHRPGSNRYGRCVGKAYAFAEIALLDLDSGREVPVGQVGHACLKSPTLAPGYWNDSVTTYRTRFKGYYLTGDLMYRDEDGYYYHVDRAVDAVDLGDGNWLYTALSEERILATCPDVRDATVVAGESDGAAGQVVTDVLLLLAPGADPDTDRGAVVRAALGEVAAATLRRVVVVPEDDLVIGPTGKVRKFLMRQRHLAASGTS